MSSSEMVRCKQESQLRENAFQLNSETEMTNDLKQHFRMVNIFLLLRRTAVNRIFKCSHFDRSTCILGVHKAAVSKPPPHIHR